MGFAVASGEVLGVMDADLSHPPDALPRLLEALEAHQADLVIAIALHSRQAARRTGRSPDA